jgi:hypothetical protein
MLAVEFGVLDEPLTASAFLSAEKITRTRGVNRWFDPMILIRMRPLNHSIHLAELGTYGHLASSVGHLWAPHNGHSRYVQCNDGQAKVLEIIAL